MSRTSILVILSIAIAGVAAGPYFHDGPERPAEATPELPGLAPIGANLLDGLSDSSMAITSSDPEVQQWFD